jgi:hypothetical protein
LVGARCRVVAARNPHVVSATTVFVVILSRKAPFGAPLCSSSPRVSIVEESNQRTYGRGPSNGPTLRSHCGCPVHRPPIFEVAAPPKASTRLSVSRTWLTRSSAVFSVCALGQLPAVYVSEARERTTLAASLLPRLPLEKEFCTSECFPYKTLRITGCCIQLDVQYIYSYNDNPCRPTKPFV